MNETPEPTAQNYWHDLKPAAILAALVGTLKAILMNVPPAPGKLRLEKACDDCLAMTLGAVGAEGSEQARHTGHEMLEIVRREAESISDIRVVVLAFLIAITAFMRMGPPAGGPDAYEAMRKEAIGEAHAIASFLRRKDAGDPRFAETPRDG